MAGTGPAGGAAEDSETCTSEDDAMMCSSGEGGADGRLPGERARNRGATDAQATEAATAATAAPPAALFRLRDSLDSAPARQPIAFVRPLTPAQLHTLGWMRQREGEDAGYSSTQTLRQVLAETDVCVEVRLAREFKSTRGGILADVAGYGKTACVIALVAETRSESLRDMLSVEEWPAAGGCRVLTNATLVVVPPGLFDQWLRELQKFLSPSLRLRVLEVQSHTRLKALTVADFVAADLVLVSSRLFCSDAYQRLFDELCKPGLQLRCEKPSGGVLAQTDGAASSVAQLAPHCAAAASSCAAAAAPAAPHRRTAPASGARPPRGAAAARGRGQRAAAPRAGRRGAAGASAVKAEATETEAVKDEPFTQEGCCQPLACSDAEPAASVGATAVAGTRAGPRPSKYYAELRARPDYLPQRQLDLWGRTRRLLAGGSAEALAQSPALLEMFHFKRVVFDELHEVARLVRAAAASTHARAAPAGLPLYSLCALSGRSHWGLTAAPLLGSASDVAAMASLLRAFVPHYDVPEAQRFLDEWARQNRWDCSDVPVENHHVEVELLGPERALYVLQQGHLAGLGAGGASVPPPPGAPRPSARPARRAAERRAAERRLLQLCSHFDPEGEEPTGAAEALEGQLGRWRAELAEAQRQRSECDASRVDLLERHGAHDALRTALPASAQEAELVCAHYTLPEVHRLAEAAAQAKAAGLASELSLVEGDLRRGAQALLEGPGAAHGAPAAGGCAACGRLAAREEHLRSLARRAARAEAGVGRAGRQLRLGGVLQRLLGADGPAGAALECESCLAAASPHEAVVLPCGHVLHEACAAKAVAEQGRCPQCERPAAPGGVASLAGWPLERPQPVSPLRACFGSKAAAVIERVREVRDRDGPLSKCIIFAEWGAVLASLERGLQTVGIPPLRLAGNPRQQKQVLSDFAAGSSAKEFALLLSFEQGCGGLSLACASHVMLVHPACSEHAASPVEQEMQAIGRALRQGRRGPVHVHRFSAKDTVEEALVRQRQEACCRASAGAAGGVRLAR